MKESRDASEVEKGNAGSAIDQHHLVCPSSSPCSDRSELVSELQNRRLIKSLDITGGLFTGVLSRADTAAVVLMQVQPGSFEQ